MVGQRISEKTLKKIVAFIETNMSVSVGTKILVPFFVVMLIVVASLSYFVVNKISEKIEQMEVRRAVAVLNSTIQSVEEERETVVTYASLLGDSVEIEQALKNSDKRKLYEILVDSKQVSRQQKIIIFDRNGQILVQVANSPKIHEDAAPLIKKGLAGITTSTLAVSENGLEIYAITPVHTSSGVNYRGPVLLLDRHIGEKELDIIKKRDGVEITLILDRTVVASTLEPALAFKVLRDITVSSQGNKLVPTRIAWNNMDYINVWRTIGSRGLISIMVPNDDLIAIKQGISMDILRTTLLAMLLVFLCATLIAKVLVGPLQTMMRITKAITQGDFTQKIEVITRDEFGELGNGINFMAERIKERLDQAEHLATVDGLTGLYNHRFFQQRIAQEIQRAERTGSALSLIILDIDYFKHYNDNLGHPAGDKVLQVIAKLLAGSIRSVDIAARYGGEEFAVILVNTGALDAYDVGERIRLAVEGYPFVGREGQPNGKVTVSLGIASYPDNASNKDDLIKLADDALYKAKYISKNKVVIYYADFEDC
ncbi:MAG: GGDEF domain-containing protein [Eubacteriales bacterium]